MHAKVDINVGLIEANGKGIVSIKRGSRLAIKFSKKFSSIKVARVDAQPTQRRRKDVVKTSYFWSQRRLRLV